MIKRYTNRHILYFKGSVIETPKASRGMGRENEIVLQIKWPSW